MSGERAKWAVLGASVVASAGLGLWVWTHESEAAGHVTEIDSREVLEELIERESAAAKGVVPLSLDELLPRQPWTPELAEKIYPMLAWPRSFEFDPVLGCRRIAGYARFQSLEEHPEGRFRVVTNSLGLPDDELLADPELRLLFAGDSQTEGVCSSEECFINLLEGELRGRHPGRRLEAVNAAMGGSNPWRYLATLEAYAELEPDAFCPVFYGGNDFHEVMVLERFYRGRKKWVRHDTKGFARAMKALPKGMGAVELRQLEYFHDNPRDEAISIAVWSALAMEMARQCEAAGIQFLPIYLPPPLAGQPGPYAADRERVLEELPRVGERIERSHRMADDWIAALRERGVEVVDLRPALAAADERLFWEDGYHLNLVGQRVVAEALTEALEPRVLRHLE